MADDRTLLDQTIIGDVPEPESQLSLSFDQQSMPIAGFITIGRDPRNHVVLDDNKASRRHAIIEVIEGRYYIRDRASTNKTYVNGAPLRKGQQHELKRGDTIVIGNTEFMLS
jgi:pSer/pThr/pTyr-binding forkhead associated (FHA) protein